MNVERRRDGGGWFIAAAVGLALLAGGAAFGDAGAEQPFAFWLESPRTTVLAGEPVVVVAWKRNTGEEVQRVFPWHRVGHPSSEFRADGPAGSLRYTPRVRANTVVDESEYVSLAPGEAYPVRSLLVLAEGNALCETPGVYSVRQEPADVYHADADALHITVVAPAGRDAEALPLWKAYVGATGADAETRAASGRRLMAEYADTIYGQWVVYQHTDLRRESQRRRQEREASRDPVAPESAETIQELADVRDLAAAAVQERLRFLIEECPQFPLKDECMLRLARALPDGAEREAQYSALLEAYPDSPAAFAAREALQGR